MTEIFSRDISQVASPNPVACLICGDQSFLCGVVDFHKSCLEQRGLKLNFLGIPVYYRRCAGCGFIFCDTFKDWSPDEFRSHIYNADYKIVDPDYDSVRPAANADLLRELFQRRLGSLRLVDYGGGNGRLAALLREIGCYAESYDPFSPDDVRPLKKGDIVTAFEVIEHAIKPQETLLDILSLLNENGIIIFSTVVQPNNIDQIMLNWWYVGPRNGHVSIFSRDSLHILFKNYGLNVASISDGLHFAFKTLPPFAAHLIHRNSSQL